MMAKVVRPASSKPAGAGPSKAVDLIGDKHKDILRGLGPRDSSFELKRAVPPRSALGSNEFGSKLAASVLVAFW